MVVTLALNREFVTLYCDCYLETCERDGCSPFGSLWVLSSNIGQNLLTERRSLIQYRVRHQVSSNVQLKVFVAVTQAGGPMLQLLGSQARKKLQHKLLIKCKQNLTK